MEYGSKKIICWVSETQNVQNHILECPSILLPHPGETSTNELHGIWMFCNFNILLVMITFCNNLTQINKIN